MLGSRAHIENLWDPLELYGEVLAWNGVLLPGFNPKPLRVHSLGLIHRRTFTSPTNFNTILEVAAAATGFPARHNPSSIAPCGNINIVSKSCHVG